VRYGLQLDERWLHDLIKDALIPSADGREPNDGQRPVYTYGFRSYRRALQIARLRGDGFVERDPIRIQLFLKGYGERDIRQALWKQYSKYQKSLIAQVRSGYADNWERIPDGHKSSLMKNMGLLDTRFVDPALQLSDDDYIALLRAAKQSTVEPGNMLPVANFQRQLMDQGLNFERLATFFPNMFGGLLMLNTEDERHANGPDPIEKVILQASSAEYEQARDFYRIITSRSAAHVLSHVGAGTGADAQKAAWNALSVSVRGDSRWASLFLVASLVLVRSSGVSLAPDEVRDALQWYAEGNKSS
jgi:hypothetical protein